MWSGFNPESGDKQKREWREGKDREEGRVEKKRKRRGEERIINSIKNIPSGKDWTEKKCPPLPELPNL